MAAASRGMRIVEWGICVVLALGFAAAGGAKLAGVPMMVELFDRIGLGQWFRLLTGSIEVLGAVALLVPATRFFAALVLAATMGGALVTHLFVIGGSPVPALVLFCLCVLVAWLTRAQAAPVLRRIVGA